LYNQEYDILVDISVVTVVAVVYMIINTIHKETLHTEEKERRGFILEITIKKAEN